MSVARRAPVIAHPPPSQFAALLRRSKFASYDPRIDQVYTAYGGDADRGNYGIKRPLTPTRKGLPVMIQTIDSYQQQSEWKPASTEARYVQRWEHLPPPRPGRDWEQTVGPHSARQPLDSEFRPNESLPKIPDETPFARVDKAVADAERAMALVRSLDASGAQRADAEPELRDARAEAVAALVKTATQLADDAAAASARLRATAVENIYAMDRTEFERYVRRLTRLRPFFHAFVRQRARVQAAIRAAESLGGASLGGGGSAGERDGDHAPPERDNLWDASTERDADHVQRLFLAAVAQQKYAGTTGSLAIGGQPHRAAGMSYAPQSALTHFFLTHAQPGRYFDTDGRTLHLSAIFAGQRVHLEHGRGRGPQAELSGDPKGRLRIAAHTLERPPNPFAGIFSAGVVTKAVDEKTFAFDRRAVYRPGSRLSIMTPADDPRAAAQRAAHSARHRASAAGGFGSLVGVEAGDMLAQKGETTEENAQQTLGTLRGILADDEPPADADASLPPYGKL